MPLRYYEGLFLFDSAEATKSLENLVAHVDALLKKHGAQVMKIEKWDDRKLTYDVKKIKRGTYLLAHYQAEPQSSSNIRRDAQLSELILRHLVTEEDDLPTKLKEREEIKKRRAEMIAAGVLPEGEDRERDRGDRGFRRERRDRDRPYGGGGGGGGYGRREPREGGEAEA